jgi:hypothetical protein
VAGRWRRLYKRSFITCTLYQVLLGQSSWSDGRGM